MDGFTSTQLMSGSIMFGTAFGAAIWHLTSKIINNHKSNGSSKYVTKEVCGIQHEVIGQRYMELTATMEKIDKKIGETNKIAVDVAEIKGMISSRSSERNNDN